MRPKADEKVDIYCGMNMWIYIFKNIYDALALLGFVEYLYWSPHAAWHFEDGKSLPQHETFLTPSIICKLLIKSHSRSTCHQRVAAKISWFETHDLLDGWHSDYKRIQQLARTSTRGFQTGKLELRSISMSKTYSKSFWNNSLCSFSSFVRKWIVSYHNSL